MGFDRSGKCLCGEVSFEITNLNPEFGACHCKMCQRWAGGALLALTVPEGSITISGLESVESYASSSWAERSWCRKCGSALWYRVTAKGVAQGTYHMPIGLLDDTSGLNMAQEIFIDEKSSAFAFAGDRPKMTGAEVFAKYAPETKEPTQ